MPSLQALRIKIFADSADKTTMLELAGKAYISGFTTNPTLMRKAGIPPISTVVLPIGNMLAVKCPVLAGMTHTWLSVATAAGIPPINTVATPGPTIVPPCVVVSPTLAAFGICVCLLLAILL